MSNEHRPMNAKEQMTLERYKDLRLGMTGISRPCRLIDFSCRYNWSIDIVSKICEYFSCLYREKLLLTFWIFLSWRYWEQLATDFA